MKDAIRNIMGKLIILFKDKSIDAVSFEHLADDVIHNQYVVSPNDPDKCIEFEANEDEITRMVWYAQFSSRDILYVLDRSEGNRERLVEGRKVSAVGGAFKFAAIVLVQLADKIFCLKNNGGMKETLRFACDNIIPEQLDQRSNVEAIYAEANEMIRSLVRSKGAECESCGYSENIEAMEIFSIDEDGDYKPINVIRFGVLRDFDEVFEEVKAGTVLCYNCAINHNVVKMDPR